MRNVGDREDFRGAVTRVTHVDVSRWVLCRDTIQYNAEEFRMLRRAITHQTDNPQCREVVQVSYNIHDMVVYLCTDRQMNKEIIYI